MTIVSEYWKGSVGTVDSWVFQRTVDFPEECGQEPAAATKHYCHQCQRLTVAVMQSPSHLPSNRRLSNFPGVDLAARNSLSGESKRRSLPSAESSRFGSVRAPRLLGSATLRLPFLRLSATGRAMVRCWHMPMVQGSISFWVDIRRTGGDVGV